MVERAKNIDEYFNYMTNGNKVKKKDIRKRVGAKDNKQFLRALEYLGGKRYLDKIGVEEAGHSYIKVS
ncbi:hypothetical protein AAK964_12315 [Tissierella praeacuta]|uniref:hypothetical protein n=1 Tax=Tissierella praeacuta TaxID=43131 RepID=UPI0035125FF8